MRRSRAGDVDIELENLQLVPNPNILVGDLNLADTFRS